MRRRATAEQGALEAEDRRRLAEALDAIPRMRTNQILAVVALLGLVDTLKLRRQVGAYLEYYRCLGGKFLVGNMANLVQTLRAIAAGAQ